MIDRVYVEILYQISLPLVTLLAISVLPKVYAFIQAPPKLKSFRFQSSAFLGPYIAYVFYNWINTPASFYDVVGGSADMKMFQLRRLFNAKFPETQDEKLQNLADSVFRFPKLYPRIGSFDCDWCMLESDYLIHRLPGALFSYIVFMGVFGLLSGHASRKHRLAVAIGVSLAMITEAVLMMTDEAVIQYGNMIQYDIIQSAKSITFVLFLAGWSLFGMNNVPKTEADTIQSIANELVLANTILKSANAINTVYSNDEVLRKRVTDFQTRKLEDYRAFCRDQGVKEAKRELMLTRNMDQLKADAQEYANMVLGFFGGNTAVDVPVEPWAE